MPFAPDNNAWLALLACPACRAGLTESASELICNGCGRRYPIRKGIPQLLLEDAINPATRPRQGDPGDQSSGQGPGSSGGASD